MTHDSGFNPGEIAAVYRAIFERRDMRHFRNEPVDAEILARLIDAACAAPSVGYMQPWRFIRITDNALREQIAAQVEAERLITAQALGERDAEFLRLKVEGIRDCGELLVVALCDQREQYIFGRRTLPEMDLASASCAIQNIWLAARAEGLGMGWVSLFDPASLKTLLHMPDDSQPIAILCLGYVDAFYPEPMLQTAGWDQRRNLDELIMENSWQQRSTKE
jgi:5,6-dimethylbenzimidazole synthase